MNSKILVIGAGGLLGNSLIKFFSTKKNFSIFATIRSTNTFDMPNNTFNNCKIFTGIDVEKSNDLESVFSKVIPNIVINCVGIIKQSEEIANNFKVISKTKIQI